MDYLRAMAYSLLVADPAWDEGGRLDQLLKGEFSVSTCKLASQAVERIRTKAPDLLLAASDLPDMDGLTLVRILRATEPGHDLPVVLRAPRRVEEAVVAGFELGVDDYLAGPIDEREVVLRLRAVLRRKYERVENAGGALTLGEVTVHPGQRRCTAFGRRVRLQPREFDLLEILMRKAGRVLTRVYLLESVWGLEATVRTRAVDVMVSRLRQRLGRRGARLIETVSKTGYCFRDPEEL